MALPFPSCRCGNSGVVVLLLQTFPAVCFPDCASSGGGGINSSASGAVL
jgi:hypothetical protein